MTLPTPADKSFCPSCHQPMTRLSLPHKTSGTVALDICFPCHGIWFDQFESVQITPGGIIDLFKLIHEHGNDMRLPIAAKLHCPRCNDVLMAGLDIARSGRFTYYRCLQNHGRFTIFGQFMIEKGFVRQLAPAEISALAARIGSVRCTGCGAAVDIRTQSACGQCGAPISILDPDAVEEALASYTKAETARTRRDPEALADAILATEQRRKLAAAGANDGGVADLVLSGIGIVWDVLSDN